jgi:hypothetical protein
VQSIPAAAVLVRKSEKNRDVTDPCRYSSDDIRFVHVYCIATNGEEGDEHGCSPFGWLPALSIEEVIAKLI